jgi:hypothetical protein
MERPSQSINGHRRRAHGMWETVACALFYGCIMACVASIALDLTSIAQSVADLRDTLMYTEKMTRVIRAIERRADGAARHTDVLRT